MTFDVKKITGEMKKISFFVAIISSMINIPMLFTPFYTMQIFDRVIPTGSLNTLFFLSFIVLFANIIYCFLFFLRGHIAFSISNWLGSKIYKYIMSKSLKIKLLNEGFSISQTIRDIESIKAFCSNPAVMSLVDAPWAVAFLIIMFFINKFCATVTLFGVILLILFSLLNEKISGSMLRESNELQIKNLREIELASRNCDAVEAMGISEKIVNLWYSRLVDSFNYQKRIFFRNSSIDIIVRFIKMMLGTTLMGIGSLCVVLYPSKYGMGGVITCSIIMGRVIAPCDSFWASWKSFISASQSYKRLKNIDNFRCESEYTTAIPISGKSLVVKSLFYAPQGTRPLLKGLSFDIYSGDVLLLLGPSGSGKTTLIKLIAGIIKPTSGSIIIDGADVAKLSQSSSADSIGFLPQYPELFDTTVRENISRMSSEPDVHFIIKVAKLAGVHEVILSLDKGYDTVVGSGSSNLSGGQKKQIAIARAFYAKNLKLLVLDEPTSNLDSASESKFVDAINDLRKKGIITVLSSHNPSLMKVATKVLAINSGAQAFFGPKEDFISKFLKNNREEMHSQSSLRVSRDEIESS